VKKGDVLGTVLAPIGRAGRLGAHVLVAFRPWRGTTSRYAIGVSESWCRKKTNTRAIHIEEFEVEGRDPSGDGRKSRAIIAEYAEGFCAIFFGRKRHHRIGAR